MGLIISASVVGILSFCKKRKVSNKHQNNDEVKDDGELDEKLLLQEKITCRNIQNTISDTISFRHKEAAGIVEDTVKNIQKQVEISTNTNEEIDRIAAELDEMLSED